jgi:hypothetical protein
MKLVEIADKLLLPLRANSFDNKQRPKRLCIGTFGDARQPRRNLQVPGFRRHLESQLGR